MSNISAVSIDAEERLNYVSVKLTMMFNDTELAIGTGFFYEYPKGPKQTFLVTNWHNVSGRHPETGECLHKNLGVPNRLLLDVPYQGVSNGVIAILWVKTSVPLYHEDNIEKPVWHERTTYGRFDVVAIALQGLEETAVVPVNSASLKLDPIHLRPGLDVFILGFPKGMVGGGSWPIWKRGSIASNPEFDLDLLPKIFVDTATREGMSGSPVFAQENGFWIPENTNDIRDVRFGIGRRFLGIYSGRVGDDPFQAQLGVVWKREAIDAVVESAYTDYLFDPEPARLKNLIYT